MEAPDFSPGVCRSTMPEGVVEDVLGASMRIKILLYVALLLTGILSGCAAWTGRYSVLLLTPDEHVGNVFAEVEGFPV